MDTDEVQLKLQHPDLVRLNLAVGDTFVIDSGYLSIPYVVIEVPAPDIIIAKKAEPNHSPRPLPAL